MSALPILLAVLMLPAPQAPSAPAQQARAPARPTPSAPELVSWNDLARNPSRYLGRDVRIRVQWHSTVAAWNPYLTRFGSVRFAAFRAWSDEQILWEPEAYAAPAARLYVRRGEASEWALAEAKPCARLEVVATVQEVFLDRPWIEVREVRHLPERVTEGTIIHAARARGLLTSGSWKLAAGEIEQAQAGNLPPAARGHLDRMMDECRRAEAESSAGRRARASRSSR